MATPQQSRLPGTVDRNPPAATGFVLPTVLGLGLILVVSSLALGYSAYQANLGGIQNLQAAQTEANAETGAAQIFNALNNEYFFLARVSNSQWTSTFASYQTIEQTINCNHFTLPGSLSNSSNPLSGSGTGWRLISYSTDPVAGVATMLVEGSQTSGAKTQVQYTYTLTSQPANGELGFPGLLAQSINLGNNDVLGVTINGQNSCSGNILCTNCQTVADVIRLSNSVVQGVISVGRINWPRVPAKPANINNLGSINDTLSLPRSGDLMAADGSYTYNVTSINLSGSQSITINTTTNSTNPVVNNCAGTPNPSGCHPVILHLSGNLSMSGNASFVHTGDPEDFIIYGNPIHDSNGILLAENQQIAQTITLNGGSVASRLFLHAPTATVGINGGSSNPDFYGAVWGKTWNGSSSNNAEIVVPADMYSRIRTLDLSPLPSNDYRLQSASSWERGK